MTTVLHYGYITTLPYPMNSPAPGWTPSSAGGPPPPPPVPPVAPVLGAILEGLGYSETKLVLVPKSALCVCSSNKFKHYNKFIWVFLYDSISNPFFKSPNRVTVVGVA